MIENKVEINLKNWCVAFAKSIQNTLHSLLDVPESGFITEVTTSTELEKNENLFFSILFTGQIYGEMIIGMTQENAVKILGLDSHADFERIYGTNREEIIENFKEVINVASGGTLNFLKDAFPDISITPPKSIEGYLSLSNYELQRSQLTLERGNLTCYIYVDKMRLDITKTLEQSKIQIQQEHEKQEELKRLNKAKSEFLANMSHELRTPLNGMIGMLDVIKGSELSSTQKEQFDLVYNSGEFLLELITDILEFSKIESGKLEIENRAFDLRMAVEGVVESLASVAFNKKLDFNVFISPKIDSFFHGDETRIKQILVNLIGNSIKFTPTGFISVRVDSNIIGEIEISVQDTGIGIPKDKMDKIFDSFTQVDVSDNRKYGGTGLGLTISKSFVSAMGGSITVQSKEAEGSIFTIRLPLKASKEKPLKKSINNLLIKNVNIITKNSSLYETLSIYLKHIDQDLIVHKYDLNSLVDSSEDDVFVLDSNCIAGQESWFQHPCFTSLKQKGGSIIYLMRPHDLQNFSELKGHLNLESSFFLKLPISLNKVEQLLGQKEFSAQLMNTPNAVSQLNKPSSEMKILVAEDNKINQIVIITMLKKLGYIAETVENGEQVLEKLASGNFYDLILMDCQMPVMNGYEAAKEIRKIDIEKNQHTKIVALTANAFRETKETCFQCGMDDFATKPIKLEVLKEVIERSQTSA